MIVITIMISTSPHSTLGLLCPSLAHSRRSFCQNHNSGSRRRKCNRQRGSVFCPPWRLSWGPTTTIVAAGRWATFAPSRPRRRARPASRRVPQVEPNCTALRRAAVDGTSLHHAALTEVAKSDSTSTLPPTPLIN